jgi:hypothetical protein
VDISENNLESEDTEIDVDILVCTSTGGSARPTYGSVRAECGECKSSVWVSVSGQKAMRERKTLRPFCMSCASEKINESGEKPKAEIVPGAIDELIRHFLKINEN